MKIEIQLPWFRFDPTVISLADGSREESFSTPIEAVRYVQKLIAEDHTIDVKYQKPRLCRNAFMQLWNLRLIPDEYSNARFDFDQEYFYLIYEAEYIEIGHDFPSAVEALHARFPEGRIIQYEHISTD